MATIFNAVIFFLELIVVAEIIKATMSKPSNIEEQLSEINVCLANYQVQLKMLQVEILKLELKKEKLMDKIILKSLKKKAAKKLEKQNAPVVNI